jgi:hypothetical protein
LPWSSRACAQLGACCSPLLRVSSFRVELLSSLSVVVSEPILGCRSIFSYLATSLVVKRVCCRELAPGVHSVSGPRFLQLGQAGHRSVLRSPRSLSSNRRSRSTRQSHLGRLPIFYSPWYNTAVRSDLQTTMAFIDLWSQPDPSVRSLFVHWVSRVLMFAVESSNPSSPVRPPPHQLAPNMISSSFRASSRNPKHRVKMKLAAWCSPSV